MKIAIASGKGGTGKTTIAINMALVLSDNEHGVTYVDCDVEEPNGHIFLKPQITEVVPSFVPVPEVDKEKCNLCGECGEICAYSAIIPMKDNVLVFPELCHGCGGCSLVCPENAINEVGRSLGVIECGTAGNIKFIQGRLRIGEAMSPPLIRELLKKIPESDIVILDSPPGTSCPVIAAIKPADMVLLVTEPTPFGLNDLKLAVEMVRKLQLPFGVIINRCDLGNDDVLEYCKREEIDILLEIPNERRIAEAYSRGQTLVEELPEYRERFVELFEKCKKGL